MIKYMPGIKNSMRPIIIPKQLIIDANSKEPKFWNPLA